MISENRGLPPGSQQIHLHSPWIAFIKRTFDRPDHGIVSLRPRRGRRPGARIDKSEEIAVMARTSKKTTQARPLFDEPVFSEGVVTPDPSHFSTRHPSDNAEYKTIEQLLFKDVVGFDKSRITPQEVYGLASAFGPAGPQVVQQIQKNGRIVFHALGDSGSSDVRKYSNEIRVFDQIADDVHTAAVTDRPSFLYHLGDVIYNFGEAKFYYDQFYEPNRNYPGPIFAIAGNHDSFVLPDTAEADLPLVTFARNFCARRR